MHTHTDNAREIMEIMKAAQDTIRARYLKLVTPYRLTITQFQTLQHLRWYDSKGGMGIGELSSHMGLANSTISGIIDRLERDGWVERERCGPDRREVKVRLKQKGVELFESIPRDVEEFWRATVGKLSITDQVELVASLKKLKEVMEKPEWPSYDEIHAGRGETESGIEDSNTQKNLLEIFLYELKLAGLTMALAQKAEEEGLFEATAYLKQIAVEEVKHACAIADLTEEFKDIRSELNKLAERQIHSKTIKLKAAYAEGKKDIKDLLEKAALQEDKHANLLQTLLKRFEANS